MSEELGPAKTICVLGATGYVGGRLVPRLLAAGHRVRAAGRSPGKIKCRPWASHPGLEIARCDVLDYGSVEEALKGCAVAYYLVHSMSPGKADFASRDRKAARNMARAAASAGLQRIVYLGGLGSDEEELSEHLQSRMEVGRTLQEGTVPLTWFRAAVILGSGSASFEILRYLAERLPVMVAPRWVRTKSQPIAISNVLHYLVHCLEVPETAEGTFDICGPDILSYHDMFQLYAEVAGLRKRVIIPVPVLTPRLSSYWINLVTPMPAALARPLAEGLRNTVLCGENSIREFLPQNLLTCRQAMERALNATRQHTVETCWSDAGDLPAEWFVCGDASYAGGKVYVSNYQAVYRCSPELLWGHVAALGGQGGWWYGNALWRFRGLVDRLLGGAGTARGRRHPKEIRTGDALDFWRVLDATPGERLLLGAEMKAPGTALLEFSLASRAQGKTRLLVTAKFLPRGLAGIVYWTALYPAHGLLFKGMLRRLANNTAVELLTGPEAVHPEEGACRVPPSQR